MFVKPVEKHNEDRLDCFHREVCWVIGEYCSCKDTECEDYIKHDDVVVKKK